MIWYADPISTVDLQNIRLTGVYPIQLDVSCIKVGATQCPALHFHPPFDCTRSSLLIIHIFIAATMPAITSQFYLPDLLALSTPFKGSTNPHYKRGAAESRAWINSFNVFTDRKRAFFIQGCNELLVSHTYPHAGYDEFRTCCDFINLLFVVDEISDEQNGADARRTGEVYLNVMRDPEWDDGSKLAQITRE